MDYEAELEVETSWIELSAATRNVVAFLQMREAGQPAREIPATPHRASSSEIAASIDSLQNELVATAATDRGDGCEVTTVAWLPARGLENEMSTADWGWGAEDSAADKLSPDKDVTGETGIESAASKISWHGSQSWKSESTSTTEGRSQTEHRIIAPISNIRRAQ